MSDSASSRKPARAQSRRFAWAKLPEHELMQVRLKNLDVTIEGTWLEECLQTLNEELRGRGLLLRAHAWISDEWFSPDNTPGISIPFYLAHPRLVRLERKMMLEAEGSTRRECMKILRHEAGHMVQHAFALHRRRAWQNTFGRSSTKYPAFYQANPASKNYVQHLRRWYAQAHPDEDFAETFAVWLTPRSNWRARYAGWPALQKLEYLDELMGEIRGQRPMLTTRLKVDAINTLNGTLSEYYKKKLDHYAIDTPTAFDDDLVRIFSNEARHQNATSASAFIRRNRVDIRRLAQKRTGVHPITLEAALDDMIMRCRALKLRAPGSEIQLRRHVTSLLTDSSMHTFYNSSRRQWFAV